ncbi:MAG: response regulator transcription factor [Dehalococcoidia bacterium]
MRVELPATDAAANPAFPTQSILIVDDDPAIVGFLELALIDEGYEVRSATNGLDALQVVAEMVPDLILLDMNMPIMNGWEFCAQLRKDQSGTIPIVVMTAARDASTRSREVGAQGYLGKPFNLDVMFQAIKGLLPPA